MSKHKIGIRAVIIRVALVIAVLGLTTIGTSAAGSRSAALNPAVFRDRDGSPVLVILLQPGPNQGSFDFVVNGVGDYHGIVPVRQTSHIYHLQGTVEAQLLPPTGFPQIVLVRFEGELDPDNSQASVNAWAGGNHYHLVTANGAQADAAKTAGRGLDAIVTRDWATLYGLMEPQVQRLYTEPQFAQIMADPTKPVIIAARLNGRGSITQALGYPIFTQPVLMTVRKSNGATLTFGINLYLVLENGSWYLLSTDMPPAANGLQPGSSAAATSCCPAPGNSHKR